MKHSTVIGIIGAMDSEIEKLASLMEGKKDERSGGLLFLSGTLSGQNVTVVKCGVGKVNAARCTQALADRFQPEFIINTGIAGALAPELSVGDVVIGTGLIQHDFDASAFGYAKGYLCTGKYPEKPTVFDSDKELVAAFEQAAAKLVPTHRVHKGLIATGDLFVSDPLKKRELRECFGAVAAEMEGAAIAQTAYANGIPFVAVRAISDLADGTTASSFDAFEREAADLSATILEELVSDIQKAGGNIYGKVS